jgi:vacuolar-type H+-ATPase subunit I/STV1
MSTELQAAESNAPVITRGPLPFRVNTLAYIPTERRQQYARTYDGDFQLAWITADDHENHTALLEQIAAGKVNVVPAGEAIAFIAAEQAAQREMRAAADAEFKRLEEKAEAERLQRIEEAHARRRAELEAELEELRNLGQPKKYSDAEMQAVLKDINLNNGV